MSKSEYKKIHDEWIQSKYELEGALSSSPATNIEVCFEKNEDSQPKRLFNTVWDLGTSFITGSIMIIIILALIGLIFG